MNTCDLLVRLSSAPSEWLNSCAFSTSEMFPFWLRCCNTYFFNWMLSFALEDLTLGRYSMFLCLLATNKWILTVVSQLIVNFKKCHEDHLVQKFFGTCNDLKIQLDNCFHEEVRNRCISGFSLSVQKSTQVLLLSFTFSKSIFSHWARFW